MIKIVRNEGQVKELAGKSKYLLHTVVGGEDVYAKPGLKPIIGYIITKFIF